MCGVFGIIGRDFPERDQIAREMAISIQHRGPDGDGFFRGADALMGMRRLSIIDLEHGWQPLYSRQNRVVVLQNGEIYNHRTLRESLGQLEYAFASHSDTEVLAHGYDAWGIDRLLDKIDGMFAITILDQDERRIFLARDRFGEKPLYYCKWGDRLAYSSDLLTLAALPGNHGEIDPHSLERYLALHFIPGERTIFKGIYRVLPGEYLSIPLDHPTKYTRTRYFTQPLQKTRHVSEEKLAGLIEQAVSSRLVSDVPVGVFLSGGLDSSIVAAIATKYAPGIDTFSMGFGSPEHDESMFAKQVAERIGSTHHHFEFNCERFCELLPLVASSLDEPIGDQATLPLYWLCGEARKHVTVVLAGEGADEIFAGYGYYNDFAADPGLRAYFRSLIKRRPLLPSIDRLIHNQQPITPSGFPLLTDIGGRKLLLEHSAATEQDKWERDLLDWLSLASDPLQRATAADLATWLPDNLLVKYDRMAMAHSLEGRAPFLSPDLVNAALHLPGGHRMAKGVSKIALRHVARRWLPSSIIERRKQGFVLPMKSWLRDWFQLQGGVRAYFQGKEIRGLNHEEICRLVETDLEAGVQRERLLFAIVLLYEWHASAQSRMAHMRHAYTA